MARRRRFGKRSIKRAGVALAKPKGPRLKVFGHRESTAAIAPRSKSARKALEDAFVMRSQELLQGIASRAPDAVLSGALAEPTPAGTLARALSGFADPELGVTDADLALAAARARGAKRKEALIEEAGGAVRGAELAELLRISRQAVSEGRPKHLYFGVPVDGGYVYPKLQLTESGTLKGLREFLDAFTLEDPWAQLLVLLSPSPRLGKKRSPLDALREGNVEDAVRVASLYGEHGG